MDGSSDFADGVHFLVDHIRRHVSALEEIAVEPPDVAIDLLDLLDFLDAVDRSGLAVAEKLRRLLALIFVISLTKSTHSGARWADVREACLRRCGRGR